MVGRIFLVLAVLAPLPARAGELTAEDVIRLVRERDPSTVAARRAASFTDSQRVAAGLYPNPSFAFNRESFEEREDFLRLNVPIDLSGRRRAREGIVHAKSLSAQAQASLTETDAVVRALGLFYRSLAEAERFEIQAAAVEALREAARVVSRRKEEGYSAGYDEARIEIELEVAKSALEQTRIRRDALHRALASLLAIEDRQVALRGDLAPADVEETESERRSVTLYDAAAERARDAKDAWTWIPAFTVSGGARLGSSDPSRVGYVAGVQVALPIFSRGQGLDAQSEAVEALATARAAATRAASRVEQERAALVFVATRAEAKRFREATEARVERLERSVTSGYREGQRTVVELIDARRARTEVALRALELDLIAKTAEVDLRAAKGAFE